MSNHQESCFGSEAAVGQRFLTMLKHQKLENKKCSFLTPLPERQMTFKTTLAAC